MPAKQKQHPHRCRRVSRRGTRHPIPAGDQGQPQGDAAHRRQAADPVRGRRGAGRGRAPPGVHHRLVQARHRRSFRLRRRTRKPAAVAGQERPAEDAAQRAAVVRFVHLHPPARAAGSGTCRAVRQAGGGRCAVLRAPRRRSHRRRGSLPQADGGSVRQWQHRRRADRAAHRRPTSTASSKTGSRHGDLLRIERIVEKPKPAQGAVESGGGRPLPAHAARVRRTSSASAKARAARFSSPTASRGS